MNYSFFVVPIFVDTIHSYLRAIERFVARLELLQPLLWVLLFSSQNNLTLFRYSSHHIGNRFTFLAMSLPYDMVRGDLEGFV